MREYAKRIFRRFVPKTSIKFYRQIHKIVINIYLNNQETLWGKKYITHFICVFETAAPSKMASFARTFVHSKSPDRKLGSGELSFLDPNNTEKSKQRTPNSQHFYVLQSPCTQVLSFFFVVVFFFYLLL